MRAKFSWTKQSHAEPGAQIRGGVGWGVTIPKITIAKIIVEPQKSVQCKFETNIILCKKDKY